uniref:Uncharacterized protein n=1 Tax=viral metagenome TaxID=1070528 RepID=A0A6M3LVQ7_9ZZZZ
MRNNDEAYTLAVYMRDMLHNEPDTEDTRAFIEHTSSSTEKMVVVTMIIPYKDD